MLGAASARGRWRYRSRAGLLRQIAVRQLWTHRTVTLIAVLTLALGSGANTAIFPVVHRLLLAPLPYRDGDRIVMLMLGPESAVDDPDAQTLWLLRSRSHSLEWIAAVVEDAVWVQTDDGLDTVSAYVTPSYLDVSASGRLSGAPSPPRSDACAVALLVGRGALRLTLVGVIVGGVAGVLSTRVLENLLYG